MTTAYTSLLGLALPVTGELSGTWGDTVNNSITSLLDTAVAGTTTISTDGDVTLTTTTGASNQARQAILLCSGARTAARNITAPAQSKIYTVINATTGGYAVVIRGAGPTTGISIPAGQTAQVAWNGSDFVDASNYFNGNLRVNGNLYVVGKELIGSVTTTNNLRFSQSFGAVSTVAANSGMALTAYSGTSAGSRSVLDFNRSRGTTDGSLTAVVNADALGAIVFRGADGTSFVDGAGVLSVVDNTVSTGAVPTALTFFTAPSGSVVNRYNISSGGVHTWYGSSVSPTINSTGFMGLGGNSSPVAWLSIGDVNNGTGEATYKGAIQIQNSGNGNAVQAGGLEFKSASAGAGYGWSIAAPDLTLGNTPLVFTRRIDSASWTEIARFTASTIPALLIGGTNSAVMGNPKIGAVSTETGTTFLSNAAIFSANNLTAGREVPGLYMNDGTNSTLFTQVGTTLGIAQNGNVRATFAQSGSKTLFGLGAVSTSQDIYVTTGATTNMSLDTTATNTYSSYRLQNGNTGGTASGVAMHYFGSTYPSTTWTVASGMGLACWGSGGTHIAQLDSGNAGKINFWTGGSGNGVLRASIPNNASGIQFPASPVLSSDVNTLDTYEEGTYNATITSTGTAPTVTYSYRTCKYTRIGNVVMVRLALDFNVTVGGTGNLLVSLPFTAASLSNFYQHWLSGYYNNAAAENVVAGGVTWGAATSVLYKDAVGNGTNAALTGQRAFEAQIFYFTETT